MKAEAQAHFTTALHLNPHNEATWRHLGYIKHHGQWLTHEEIAAENHEALCKSTPIGTGSPGCTSGPPS